MDIVDQLRKFHADIVASDGGESGQMAMTREAADTIQKLRNDRLDCQVVMDSQGLENARLRAALKDIVAVAEGGDDWTHEAWGRIKAAKAALADGQ